MISSISKQNIPERDGYNIIIDMEFNNIKYFHKCFISRIMQNNILEVYDYFW